jgi:hypothetical protein
MRNLILFAIALLSCNAMMAQENVKFTVTVSTDSILLGNDIKVSFKLENGEGHNFSAPEFEPHFTVINGPNTFTSMSMMNGKVSQTIEYSFYIHPKETGSFFIPAASIDVKGKTLETKPLEVTIWPNPEGIKVTPEKKAEKDDFFGQDFNFPSFRDFPMFRDFPSPWGNSTPQPGEEPKKKRKTYKL